MEHWSSRGSARSVAPHAGSVDRNQVAAVVDALAGVAPHAGSVDRNYCPHGALYRLARRSPLRDRGLKEMGAASRGSVSSRVTPHTMSMDGLPCFSGERGDNLAHQRLISRSRLWCCVSMRCSTATRMLFRGSPFVRVSSPAGQRSVLGRFLFFHITVERLLPVRVEFLPRKEKARQKITAPPAFWRRGSAVIFGMSLSGPVQIFGPIQICVRCYAFHRPCRLQ